LEARKENDFLMTENEVTHILCAVRGIPQSRETVTYAIQMALNHGARLTFVHVNDAGFMASASPTLTSLATVYKQMRDMSEFTLQILCDRATRRGVERVDYQILEGRLLEQIRNLLLALQPDILVIGKPITKAVGESGIDTKELEDFTIEIGEQTNTAIHTVDINFDDED
jgi:nucleotide-binding universal stress UspA family protein